MQQSVQRNSKFYVGINNKGYGDDWFINQPMGKNTLSNIIKSMTDEAGLQSLKANHSLSNNKVFG